MAFTREAASSSFGSNFNLERQATFLRPFATGPRPDNGSGSSYQGYGPRNTGGARNRRNFSVYKPYQRGERGGRDNARQPRAVTQPNNPDRMDTDENPLPRRRRQRANRYRPRNRRAPRDDLGFIRSQRRHPRGPTAPRDGDITMRNAPALKEPGCKDVPMHEAPPLKEEAEFLPRGAFAMDELSTLILQYAHDLSMGIDTSDKDNDIEMTDAPSFY